ncbi:MAG: phosphoenolpyruvate synthase [Patescibacteria group bacterium]|nr:phosphoenolpyruvate synthase [Patescibacteria group bacterium]
MVHQKKIVWFEEVDKNNIALVGGKGANLGEMINAGFPIPYGFIITANAYFEFIEINQLRKKINDILSMVNYDNPVELHQASKHIREIILKGKVSHSLINEIIYYYENLLLKEEKFYKKKSGFHFVLYHKLKSLYHQPLVAVRSSATAEDLPSASFAGQQETFLNIKGETNLILKVKESWASLFTERAIYYRHKMNFDHLKVGLASVVQRMVQSDKSGIAFSIDPITNDRSKIIIEAIYGLGEYIVGGKVTPDHYEIDKRSFVIIKKEIKNQTSKLMKVGTNNKEIRLKKSVGTRQKLSEKEILKLALLIADIEKHYYFPQDIEWAIEGNDVYIVQSRPITTIQQTKEKQSVIKITNEIDLSNQPILIGSPASPGIGVGSVKIIHSPSQIDLIKKGDVLVAPQTNPDYVPAMKKSAAIITEKGGRTSHAAIVSRELGIPAVVGAEKATKILKNEMIVSVNGSSGEIFKGSILSSQKLVSHNLKKEEDAEKKPILKTLTKVYVNLAEPEKADSVAQMNVDGIGLLRAEFMIAEIGVHPKEFIKQKKEKLFINQLTDNLLKFVKPFHPRPVVYRATDFKTNEYRHLNGGRHFEPIEENPMLGFRGASRYIANPDVFSLELQAIKKVWEAGFQNLHLMIPFVRTPIELLRIKEIINKHGLFSLPGFKLWIMVEVPACALNLEEFIKIGFDGVSIGTNDLTMMLLGVDRDNSEVSYIYDERNPVVIEVLKNIVKTCQKHHITCSICGQAASDYPEIVEVLINAGITSVSVNPDAIDRTRELIHQLEKKIIKNKKVVSS